MPTQRRYFVYIVSSQTKRLYVGVTNDLQGRVAQHKRREVEGFTSRYNVDQLVYYEETDDVRDAISREKQLNGWMRIRKIQSPGHESRLAGSGRLLARLRTRSFDRLRLSQDDIGT